MAVTPPADDFSHSPIPVGTPAPTDASVLPSPAPAPAGRTHWSQLGLICSTQFMAWAGFGAILPFLPIFLRDEAHASYQMIGLVASAYFVGTFLFSSPFGRLSDVIGRKPVILTGVVLYTVATFLFVTTSNPLWFIVFRFVEGMGAAAAGPAGNAFVADITTENNRSKAFGILTTAQFGGLVAGPLLGASIMGAFGGGMRGFTAIFLVCSGTMALIGILLATFLREPAHVTRRRKEKVVRPSYGSLLTTPIAAFILIAATSHFAMGAWEVCWSLWLQHLGASTTFIGWTWAAFSIPMLLSVFGGVLADHASRFWLMYSGYTLSAIIWIIYGSTSNLKLFLVVSVIEGLAIAWSFPAKQAFLVQVSPRRWVGSVQGMETTAMQLAALIGTLTAPMIYAEVGGFAIGIGGIVALIGLMIAAPIHRREWKRIVASGEMLKARDAERLATAPAPATPTDDIYTVM